MPPKITTNSATNASVAASLQCVERSDADAPHHVDDDRQDDERERAPQQRAQRAVQEHD